MESWSLSFNSMRTGAVDPVSAVKALGPSPLPLNFDPATRVGQGQNAAGRLRRLELDASNPALAKARFRSDARAMTSRLADEVERPLLEGWRDALTGLAALAKAPEGSVTEAQVRQVAAQVADLASQLNVATNAKGVVREDALAQDLRDALNAQFKPSAGGQARTLGDLGFRLDAQGELQSDDDALRVALRPGEMGPPTAADRVVANDVFMLASAGSKAIIDALQQAPSEARLAEQNVRARAEIARLELRQRQLLIFDAFVSNQRTRMKVQSERLEQEQKAEDGPAWPLGAKTSPAARPTGPLGPLSRPPEASDPMAMGLAGGGGLPRGSAASA